MCGPHKHIIPLRVHPRATGNSAVNTEHGLNCQVTSPTRGFLRALQLSSIRGQNRRFSNKIVLNVRELTIKFANSPPRACRGSSGQKPQYGLMTLAYQRFTAVLLLIYVSLSL
jgi:hypothetical protein